MRYVMLVVVSLIALVAGCSEFQDTEEPTNGSGFLVPESIAQYPNLPLTEDVGGSQACSYEGCSCQYTPECDSGLECIDGCCKVRSSSPPECT